MPWLMYAAMAYLVIPDDCKRCDLESLVMLRAFALLEGQVERRVLLSHPTIQSWTLATGIESTPVEYHFTSPRGVVQDFLADFLLLFSR